MELTKEHFDQAIKGLATQDSVDELVGRLTTVETTLANHTTTLDGLAKDVKKLLDEKTVSVARFDRLEHWAQLVGEKVGLKLEL
jgi:hypothetical protein